MYDPMIGNCGHTFCRKCVEGLSIKVCIICDSDINEFVENIGLTDILRKNADDINLNIYSNKYLHKDPINIKINPHVSLRKLRFHIGSIFMHPPHRCKLKFGDFPDFIGINRTDNLHSIGYFGLKDGDNVICQYDQKLIKLLDKV